MPYLGSPCESEEGERRSLTHSLTPSPPGNAPPASPGCLRTSSSSPARPLPSSLPGNKEAGAVQGMLPPEPAPSAWQRMGSVCKNPKSRRWRAKRAGASWPLHRADSRRGRGGRSKQARQFLLMSLLKIPATKRSNCK